MRCTCCCVRAPWAHEWAGRRSNPRLRFFRPPLDRLSYQPVSMGGDALTTRPRKKARRRVTPGLVALVQSRAKRQWRIRSMGALFGCSFAAAPPAFSRWELSANDKPAVYALSCVDMKLDRNIEDSLLRNSTPRTNELFRGYRYRCRPRAKVRDNLSKKSAKACRRRTLQTATAASVTSNQSDSARRPQKDGCECAFPRNSKTATCKSLCLTPIWMVARLTFEFIDPSRESAILWRSRNADLGSCH